MEIQDFLIAAIQNISIRKNLGRVKFSDQIPDNPFGQQAVDL